MPANMAATLTETMLYSSVQYSDVWLPSGSVQGFSSKFVERLFCFPDRSAAAMYAIGSCTQVKHRDRYFAVATQHQIGHNVPENIFLRTELEYLFSTAGRFNFATRSESDEVLARHDICAFDLSQTVERGKMRSGNFFNLDGQNVLGHDDEVLGFIARGFAYEDNEVDVDLSDESCYRLISIHGKNRSFICDKSTASMDPTLLHIERLFSFDVDVNGFSGGPVFAIVCAAPLKFTLKMAGILVRGGGKHFYAVSALDVLAFLDAINSD